MDSLRNPFTPGAGAPPPELAGREEIIENARVALERIRRGRPAKSLLLIGLRGVGKTVLLNRLRQNAEAAGFRTVRIEAPENRSLPAILAPQLRQALLALSTTAKASAMAKRGLRALAGFAKGLKIKYADIEVGFDAEPEPGLADNGDLEHDLQSLLEVAGQAAQAAESALVLFIDELQYVPEEQLAALITALHRASQSTLPVTLIGAGLPQLPGRMGNAKSYAERLFDFPTIGPLDDDAARQAIANPLHAEGVSIKPDALQAILTNAQGYPYFLQEWGKHAWDAAIASPIILADIEQASITAVAALDESFFRVRFDRLTPAEKRYLRAMAELGPGPHRSGEIARVLQKKVTAVGLTRANLIAKGMVWSPDHGDTAFTVPLFDTFMKRIMPGTTWLTDPAGG